MRASFDIQYVGLLEGHNGSVTSLVCGENKDGSPLLISGSRDKSIIIWKLHLSEPEEIADRAEFKVGAPLKSLHGHNHFVSSLALSSDNKKLVSASWDKTARLWDLSTSKTQQIFTGHTKDILAVSFSNDERLIFTGAMDKTLKYWNCQGDLKFSNNQFNGWVSSILNIKKGKENLMAVGSWDSDVRIFSSDYSTVRTIKGNDYGVNAMSCSDEGDFLFVAHKNGTVNIWNIGSDSAEDTLKESLSITSDINAINFQNKYFQIYALGTSSGLEIREIKGNKVYGKTLPTETSCNAITYSANKDYLFAGFADGTIRVFKVGVL